MKYYLIEAPDKSERVIASSLNGYEDWTVLGEPTRMKLDEEDWDAQAQKWKVNPKRKAKREREAKARDPNKLLEMIENLEARVAQLEGATK